MTINVDPQKTPDAPAAASRPSGDLVLTPPAPVTVVAPGQAQAAVKLDPETEARLNATVDAFVRSLEDLDQHTEAFQQKVNSVSAMGETDIRQSAAVSNRLLDKPVQAMNTGGIAPASKVSGSLIQLRRTVEDLDPGRHGMHDTERRLLGVIPFGSRVRDYFQRYQSAQTHLNAIINALYEGQDELRKDNASIEQEKVNLWTAMQRLQQYDYMAKKLDATLEARIAELQATDPDKAKMMKEDVLFYVRQKDQDLLTQLAVSVQGYLALELIRKNNVELIKGVDRATTTTVSALRTAVIVAQALANQKLVLDQITALNTTTGNIIESTSEMLKQQSAAIGQEAASSTVSVEKLQTAFNNVYAAMDQIDTFKLQALDSMKQTVNALTGEVARAQSYLERAQRGAATERVASELRLPGETG